MRLLTCILIFYKKLFLSTMTLALALGILGMTMSNLIRQV